MKKLILIVFAFSTIFYSFQSKNTTPKKPKLVVGIVIDQMRYDYLTRFADRYSENGFKRLLNDGFSL